MLPLNISDRLSIYISIPQIYSPLIYYIYDNYMMCVFNLNVYTQLMIPSQSSLCGVFSNAGLLFPTWRFVSGSLALAPKLLSHTSGDTL
jgi:hypothetical protein